MSTAQNFEVDTADYLGFKYEEYKNDIMAIAISNPSEYFKMRKKTLDVVKTKVIDEVYKTYFGLLTNGLIPGNLSTLNDLKPCYPKQKASEFALGVSETINQILNEAIEIILPKEFTDLANDKLTQKGKAGKIEAL